MSNQEKIKILTMTNPVSQKTTKIRLVCATRLSKDDFFKNSLTGKSFLMLRTLEPIDLVLFVENSTGLPQLYNRAIEESLKDPAILAFIHDDVLIPDLFFGTRLREGLEVFDILGVAGNQRRVDMQPAWLFKDRKFTWDRPYLSGSISHGNQLPPRNITHYGPSGMPAKLLDGVLLAAHSKIFSNKALRFDERFRFHFYDMDFCRSAEQVGLKMGTWPLSLVHDSGGKFGGEQWQNTYRMYIEKWGS